MRIPEKPLLITIKGIGQTGFSVIFETSHAKIQAIYEE